MFINCNKTIILLMGAIMLAGLLVALPVKAQETFYPDGSLVKGSTPQVYFLSDGLKRWITTEEAFNDLQFNWHKIMRVSDEVIEQYPDGSDIKNGRSYPDGALVKGSTPEVYYIEKGKRRWIQDEDTFLALNLWWSNIFVIEDAKLEKIGRGEYMPILKYTPFRPNTVITEFPEKVIEETDIRFEFKAVSSSWDTSNIIFESFLTGKDKGWISNGSKQYRTFRLPKESGRYTFFVRAKEKDGYTDLVPARYQFEIRISPYYDKVTLNGGSVKTSDYQKEKFEIYNRANYPVNITGWTVSSERGSDLYKVTEASFVPIFASLETPVNVELQSREKVMIYTAPSPLGFNHELKTQYGFKINKCTGYLNNKYGFDPQLPKQCPKIELNAGQRNSFGEECNDFVKSLKTCHHITLAELDQLKSGCYDWVKANVNYEGCVQNHRYDTDFFKEQWYLYMGRTQEAWNNKDDVLILKDEQGLVVDRYEY